MHWDMSAQKKKKILQQRPEAGEIVNVFIDFEIRDYVFQL